MGSSVLYVVNLNNSDENGWSNDDMLFCMCIYNYQNGTLFVSVKSFKDPSIYIPVTSGLASIHLKIWPGLNSSSWLTNNNLIPEWKCTNQICRNIAIRSAVWVSESWLNQAVSISLSGSLQCSRYSSHYVLISSCKYMTSTFCRILIIEFCKSCNPCDTVTSCKFHFSADQIHTCTYIVSVIPPWYWIS